MEYTEGVRSAFPEEPRLNNLLTVVLLALLPMAGLADEPQPIAVLDFELLDDQGMAGADDHRRVREASLQLREELLQQSVYRPIDLAPARELIEARAATVAYLYTCNGCAEDIAAALGVDRVMLTWVQKVSNLILNLNVEVRNVSSGRTELVQSVDLRGNNDQSFQRGVRYLVRRVKERLAQR